MPDTAPATPTTAEAALLRLFRCMNSDEQEHLVRHSLDTLGERCSLDPHYVHLQPEAIQEELQDENLDGRLMSAWPGGWPGQQIVQLDDVGDPGLWLEEKLSGNMVQCLFGFEDEQSLVECLAQDYLSEIRGKGLELPSDYGDDPNPEGWTADDENQVRTEFAAFLEHWRERVLVTLEKHNGPHDGA